MKQAKQDVQILVAAMHQQDLSIAERMHIATDVIIANQADRTGFQQMDFGGFQARMITTQTRGVGINRNLALHYADGDILLLADDDVVYHSGYAQMVQNAFAAHPDADAIIFNIALTEGSRSCRINKKASRVRIFNALNYGAVRIAVRRESLLRSRIHFSTLFGGGALFSSGEDTLFLCDMLRSGFRIYTCADTIATVDQSDSTWFSGYNEKYLYDKGALYCAAFPRFPLLFCLQDLIRHPYLYRQQQKTLLQALQIMRSGIHGYHTLTPWKPAVPVSDPL